MRGPRGRPPRAASGSGKQQAVTHQAERGKDPAAGAFRPHEAPKQAPTELTITIDKSQRVFVNKTLVAPADLGTMLVQKAGGPNVDLASATVIINGDTSVPHGLVVKCIDDARGVGITHFAIATAPQYSAR